MGTYYAVFCEQKKEFIQPPGNCANKFPGLSHKNNIFGHLVVFIMATSWYEIDVTMINTDNAFYYLHDYKNVTEETLQLWLQAFLDK